MITTVFRKKKRKGIFIPPHEDKENIFSLTVNLYDGIFLKIKNKGGLIAYA